jgi:hypothetical protein
MTSNINAKENDGWEPIPKEKKSKTTKKISAWSAPLLTVVEFICTTHSLHYLGISGINM